MECGEAKSAVETVALEKVGLLEGGCDELDAANTPRFSNDIGRDDVGFELIVSRFRIKGAPSHHFCMWVGQRLAAGGITLLAIKLVHSIERITTTHLNNFN